MRNHPDHPIRLGLISALKEEQAGLMDIIENASVVTRGRRDYVTGSLWGIDCVCVLSRVGKVAAAATVATLIERFGVTHILFTGVAGAADANVRIGDIVVADSLIQHDMNAAPLFPRFEVPLIDSATFAPDTWLTTRLTQAVQDFLTHDFATAIDATDRATFRLDQPRVHYGLIASGDEFITGHTRQGELKAALPALLAVEMEGAAVAQVCFEFDIPFAVVRTISDDANEHAPLDFMRFIERVAARYAFDIIKRICSPRPAA